MKVSILGAGRWGSTLAWAQNQQKRRVTLWNCHDDFLLAWQKTRKNKYLKLSPGVLITGDLSLALTSEVIFIAIKAQHFSSLCKMIRKARPKNRLFIRIFFGVSFFWFPTFIQIPTP